MPAGILNEDEVNRGCQSYPHDHITLRGKAPDGRSWTAMEGPYWPAFAKDWAASWDKLRDSRHDGGKAAQLSGLLGAHPSRSLSEALTQRELSPSRHRDRNVVASRAASATQIPITYYCWGLFS